MFIFMFTSYVTPTYKSSNSSSRVWILSCMFCYVCVCVGGGIHELTKQETLHKKNKTSLMLLVVKNSRVSLRCLSVWAVAFSFFISGSHSAYLNLAFVNFACENFNSFSFAMTDAIFLAVREKQPNTLSVSPSPSVDSGPKKWWDWGDEEPSPDQAERIRGDDP